MDLGLMTDVYFRLSNYLESNDFNCRSGLDTCKGDPKDKIIGFPSPQF